MNYIDDGYKKKRLIGALWRIYLTAELVKSRDLRRRLDIMEQEITNAVEIIESLYIGPSPDKPTK